MKDISISRVYREGTWEHTLTVRTDDADLMAALVRDVEAYTSEINKPPVFEADAIVPIARPDCGGVVMSKKPQDMTAKEVEDLNNKISEATGMALPTPKPEPKKVTLRDARRFSGKTSAELSKAFGVSQQTWLIWERAPHKVSLYRRPQVAKAVGYDVDRIDWQDHHVQVYPQGTDGGK